MKDGAKVLGGVAEDVIAIVREVLENAPVSEHERVSAALGGISLALARCAYNLEIPKEYLKERVCGDIDEIYAVEDAFNAANMQ